MSLIIKTPRRTASNTQPGQSDTMGTITPAMKHFLGADKYAVIGRVMTDPSRWDHKASLNALLLVPATVSPG
jgi:hypothetical protein